ncbi:MAG TPA: hypothetical protein VM365_09345, partial [Gemmatimonadales bacterium]|nr:hypothetical protein [Gemmatimonadales bacterium]
PTLFAVVPALEWMGLQGGTYQGVAVLLFTLCLNGALWGAVLGVALGLAALRSEGCEVDDRVETSEFGRFGWVVDPEGNRLELWEPPRAP